MNHKVKNVQELHDTAVTLYRDVVVGGESSADAILNNLVQGIEILKNNWKGRDAGYRIQELIKVHNAMVTVRNALASLAVDSSKVAANYRDIQIANGAKLDTLSVLSFEPKTNLEDYSDNSPGVDVPPVVETGRVKIDNANNGMDTFITNVKVKYDQIMQNWTAGTGRDAAESAFTSFITNANQYKQTLSDASLNIANALKNFNMMN